MRLILEVNPSRELGLPGHFSPRHSLTLHADLADIRQVDPESSRLCDVLQGCVDRDIHNFGRLGPGDGRFRRLDSRASGPMVAGVVTTPATNALPPAPRPAGPGRWLGWLVAAGLIVAGWRLLPVQEWLRRALEALRDLGPLGPVLFILLYVVAAVLLVPGSVLTLGAGAVFGVVRGSLYSSIAATLGATAAFLVGRHLARNTVARRLEGHPRFAAIDRAVAEEGWKIVGLTRLSPVFPYTLLNYAFGLTRVKLGHYVLASWIGMMPGTVLYVYLGSLAGAAAGDRTRTPAEWGFYAVGGVATLLVTVVITRIARRTLARRLPPGQVAP